MDCECSDMESCPECNGSAKIFELEQKLVESEKRNEILVNQQINFVVERRNDKDLIKLLRERQDTVFFNGVQQKLSEAFALLSTIFNLYGLRHNPTCVTGFNNESECDCGLTETSKRAREFIDKHEVKNG